MKLSTPYCKIPSQYSSYSYKYPKLSELYRTLFNEDFQDAHNAESDIHATLRCYFELVARGVIEKCNKNETLGVLNVRLSEKNRTMEEEAWECCTTIKACEEYLRIYPFGIHVADIEEKLDDLTFNSCKSIKNYGEYLKRFIQGKHIEDAECRMFKLCKIDYDFEQFLRFRPNGKYAIEAERALDDRNWGKRSNFWGYKKYLKEYPKGVHSKEAEGLVRNTKKWFLICSVSLVILGIHIAAALFSDSFWDGFFIPAYVECTLLILCCGILIYDGILYLWEKFLSIFKIF